MGGGVRDWCESGANWRGGQPSIDGLPEKLGVLPGSIASEAHSVSGDGSLVVGASYSPTVAFVWDRVHGIRALGDVLTNDFGIDLTGWTLADATGISADGRVLVAYGVDPDGHDEGWRVDLAAPVPEPSPGSASIVCFVFMMAFRTCRRSR